MKWPTASFESLYALPSKNGLNRPSKVRGSGIKMINMGELFAYDRIGTIDMELVSVNDREMENMTVERDDLLFARQSLVLSGAGKCSIVNDIDQPTTFESHIIRVRLDKTKAVPSFYHYYFKSPSCGIRSIVTQGVQAGIRSNDLKTLQVVIPPIDVQERISSQLTTYDDLIENNRRRMALLEDSARQLYREWFVRLRFPGYEHTRIVEGVPEGWLKGSFNDLVEIQSGFAFKTGTYESDGQYAIVTIKNVQDGEFIESCDNYILEPPKQLSELCHLKNGDILLSLTGNVGRCCLVVGEGYLLNQRVAKLIPKKRTTSAFCYFTFRDDGIKSKLLSISYGAAQQNLSPINMGNLPFTIPSMSLMVAFNEFAQPITDQLITLKQQNQKLRTARDHLLPRLMSGELAV